LVAYYNENDKYAAQWLRNLIQASLIAPGEVDERSITDVSPDDLKEFVQCHFFAGIAGWSYALRLAGWDDDRPVWAGSCPCQPFSAAGKGAAADDAMHLWPTWFSLVAKCRPPIIFGEQVEAAIGWGWLDLVLADLEKEGYACAAAVLPACGIGAPHVRNRLWFVADSERELGRIGTKGLAGTNGFDQGEGHQREWIRDDLAHGGKPERMADSMPTGWPKGRPGARQATRSGGASELAFAESEQFDGGRNARGGRRESANSGHWSAAEWLQCTDGKARPAQPGIFPLAHGVSARMGKLRAAGNAIVPQVAAEFIAAFMECAP
jgi:DNA (cytosine-5)-methyltransferase 1